MLWLALGQDDPRNACRPVLTTSCWRLGGRDYVPMIQDASEFRDLIRRIQGGERAAVDELLQRYGKHVLRAVRRKLHPRIRSKFDSLDFVQDVWASFFIQEAHRCNFDRPEALIQFLENMARNK